MVDVTRIPHGWRVTVEPLTLDAEHPHQDRGAIRATLTVREGTVIHHRDTVNLTSGRARSRLVQHLADKGLSVEERILIALDEACRRGTAGRGQNACDGGADVSETVPLTLSELRSVFGRWLLIADEGFLPILTGAILAHGLGGEPVWLLVVAPPGGTKTEPLRAFYGYPGIYPLSELTARTFASGLDTGGSDPSLLARLSHEILVLKDLTTVLEGHREERQAILAQLREIYDGRFDKAWGTGRELHWEGRLGFVAGVTPVIDSHQQAMSVLGERFVLFRPRLPDRRRLARFAVEHAGQEEAMRRALVAAMHGFLAARPTAAPAVPDPILDRLAMAADFVTRARSAVIRDGYRRELQYAPEPEAPTRLVKVLRALAQGIALAHDSPTVERRDLALVLRVALDCLPVVRRRVIAALVQQATVAEDDPSLSTSKVAGAAHFSTATIRRALEDLEALGITVCRKQGKGLPDHWALEDPWCAIFQDLDAASLAPEPRDEADTPPTNTVSETSEGASHPNVECGGMTSFRSDNDAPEDWGEPDKGECCELCGVNLPGGRGGLCDRCEDRAWSGAAS
jgi:hypothetical protein